MCAFTPSPRYSGERAGVRGRSVGRLKLSQGPRLTESYSHCRAIVLQARSNLGRAFWLLPDPQRRGMDALYAFAREADDIVDNPADETERTSALHYFRQSFEQALAGAPVGDLFPALIDTIQRYQIPPQHLFDLLDGCAMDLEPRRYASWEELREYCLRVASSVGLACLCIWNCRDPAARQPAIDCGLALQLTNILRDLRADAALGRVYLPQDDLARFGVSESDLLSGATSAAACELIRFEAARARELYQSAWQAMPLIPQPARRLYWLMHQTYSSLLKKIEHEPKVVFERRVGLSWPSKLWLATRATLGI
jgi:phytoene synthase